ncbi:peptidoglycan-binding protein [Azorhizobium doebereinerae]|uniref:peptidoglycan-binding protein n=1 Tax=Azorhizobium doebereinerae TaxID=281091 RepID=UPI0004205BFF|nr:peptidoglycan-binding protein [Azorhizobium doebereinerae]
MPTFSALKGEYARLWSTMQIVPTRAAAADAMAKQIIAGKPRYLAVTAATGVPYHVIGLIHAMEASLSFSTHLHNGDPLTARTKQVPNGRPRTGSPPFPWEASAADALRYDGLDTVKEWRAERIAFVLEGYNGWGYRNFHPTVLSPYLWSFSSHYSKGKYGADGDWGAGLVSQQCGAMVLLSRLIALDPSIQLAPSGEVAPDMDVEDLQLALNVFGYGLEPDGRYGPKTDAALSNFESRLAAFKARRAA